MNKAAKFVDRIVREAHRDGVAMVIVAVQNGQIVSGDHLDCADLRPEDDAAAKAVSVLLREQITATLLQHRAELRVANVTLMPSTRGPT